MLKKKKKQCFNVGDLNMESLQRKYFISQSFFSYNMHTQYGGNSVFSEAEKSSDYHWFGYKSNKDANMCVYK